MDMDLPAYVDSLVLMDLPEAAIEGVISGATDVEMVATAMPDDEGRGKRLRIEKGEESIHLSDLSRLFDTYGVREGTVIPKTQASATLQGTAVRLSTNNDAIPLATFFKILDKNKTVDVPDHTVEIATQRGALSRLTIPIARSTADTGEWIAPSNLASIIGAARYQAIQYEHSTGNMLPLRDAYPGFRLYAKNLEDVAELRRELANQGIQVRTNEDRITPILTLDAALGKFLAFIITAGALGGCGALFASIHLSVERSRRSFAALQLMGVPPFYMVASSIFQAVMMVCAGTFFAFLLFQAGSNLLESVFSGSGEIESRICILTFGQWLTLLAAALVLAVVASFPALLKARCKDPAVIARSE
jgi:ABC-type antimicrobial peptide transport system permease subunit